MTTYRTVVALTFAGLIVSGCQMGNSGSGKQVDGGVTNQNNPLYSPDYYYEIDTWGTNADVYEFTPKSNSSYVCIVVGTGQGRTLQCIRK